MVFPYTVLAVVEAIVILVSVPVTSEERPRQQSSSRRKKNGLCAAHQAAPVCV